MEWTSFSSRGSSRLEYGGRLVGVAACAVQLGNAPVQLFQDHGPDLIRLGADDLDLGAALAQHQHLVQHDGVYDHHHHAVQDLFHGAGHGLRHQDHKIHQHHGGRYRQAEPLLQHQRRDIHAAGGGPGPDHHAQGTANAQTGKDRAKQDVIGQDAACQQVLPQADECRAEQAAGQCVQRKGPAQHRPAQRQHRHVDNEQHAGHWQPGHTVDGQSDAGSAAGDQPGRDQEQHHRQ